MGRSGTGLRPLGTSHGGGVGCVLGLTVGGGGGGVFSMSRVGGVGQIVLVRLSKWFV